VNCDKWEKVVSSTNKTDCHHISEILLKVALNTIILTPPFIEILNYSGTDKNVGRDGQQHQKPQ
jgi:hypothetical protein